MPSVLLLVVVCVVLCYIARGMERDFTFWKGREVVGEGEREANR